MILDGIVIVLLGVTIFYAVVLSRRLAALRAAEGEMGAKLEAFDAAAAKAEASLAAIKQATPPEAGEAAAGRPGAGRPLDERAEAQVAALKDDLTLLIARGETLADKLEAQVRRARGAATRDGDGDGDRHGDGARPANALQRAVKGGALGTPPMVRPRARAKAAAASPAPPALAGPDAARGRSAAELALSRKLRSPR